jgi:DNA-binding GntR family transcriptional regulator
MAMAGMKPVKTASKSSEVLQAIREAIFSGELKPGDALREAHLARQLQVSQVPVREALLQLEHLGLVVRVRDRGTTITALTRAEMLNLLEVRAHLESLAFLNAAKHFTPEIELRLRQCIEAMHTAVRRGDHYAVAEADLNFHRVVWAASRNTILERLLEQLCVSVYAFVSVKRHLAHEAFKEVVSAHEKLIDVLKSGTARKIKSGIEEHLNPEASIPESVSD